MSDKYASLSPYVYCADNPIKLVDPNGEEVIVTGTAADEYVQGLNTSNLKFSRDEEGRVSYEGTPKTKIEIELAAAVDNQDIIVNICAENSNCIDNVGGCTDQYETLGGSFLGTVYENGKVNTYQQVNPSVLRQIGKDIAVGRGMYEWHELTESYEAGIISLDYRFSSPRAGVEGSIYKAAHDKASFAYRLIKTPVEIQLFPLRNGSWDFSKTINVTFFRYSIDENEY